MKFATRFAMALGPFLLVGISCSSSDSGDAEPPASEAGDDNSATSVAQSTTSGVSFGGATSSSDTDAQEEVSAPDNTDSDMNVESTDAVDAANTEGATCPNVADECPSECRELIGNPINFDDGCVEPDGVVVGCTSNTGSTGEYGCITRLSDGVAFMAGGFSDYDRGLWDVGDCGSEDATAVALDLSTCSE